MVTDPQLKSSPTLVKETARVVSVDGEYAWVEAQATSGCQSCEVNQSCGTGLLRHMFGRRIFHHRIRNTLDARPGELVIVGVPQGGLLLASLIIYSLPIVTLFAAALVAQVLLFPEWGIVLVALFGLAFGLLMSGWAGKRLEKSVKTRISMLCKADSNMVLQIE